MDHRTKCPARTAPRENRCICPILDETESIGVRIGMGKAIGLVRTAPDADCWPDHINREALIDILLEAS